MNIDRYAPLFLRLAVALPFLLLGIDQLLHPQLWLGYLAPWAHQLLATTPEQFFFMNGLFDSVLGVLLLVGMYTRIFAIVAVLHLLGVLANIGYNEIAIRDIGILLSAAALACLKKTAYSVDAFLKKQ